MTKRGGIDEERTVAKSRLLAGGRIIGSRFVQRLAQSRGPVIRGEASE
jgi:tryptophan synthase alpha subunit